MREREEREKKFKYFEKHPPQSRYWEINGGVPMLSRTLSRFCSAPPLHFAAASSAVPSVEVTYGIWIAFRISVFSVIWSVLLFPSTSVSVFWSLCVGRFLETSGCLRWKSKENYRESCRRFVIIRSRALRYSPEMNRPRLGSRSRCCSLHRLIATS